MVLWEELAMTNVPVRFLRVTSDGAAMADGR